MNNDILINSLDSHSKSVVENYLSLLRKANAKMTAQSNLEMLELFIKKHTDVAPLISLHIDLMNHMSRNKESTFCSVYDDYMLHIDITYRFAHSYPEQASPYEELAEDINPDSAHLSWLKTLNENYLSCSQELEDNDKFIAFIYFFSMYDKLLPFNEFIELIKFKENSHHSMLAINDYTNWYLRSKNNFLNGETKNLEKLKKTFQDLVQHYQSEEKAKELAFKNHKVHPLHTEQLLNLLR